MVNRRILSLSVLLLSATIGCQRSEEISTYTTQRQESPRQPIDYAAFAQQLDHTLAAILPQGKRAWFFKLAGPKPAIDRRRADFLNFLTTVSPAETPAGVPTWQLPEGWEEKPPTSEFITTVLVVPDDDGPLELSVSSLERSGDWQDFVARNVNRWLRQLSQGPLDAATIDKLTQQVATGAGPATLIELAGMRQKSPQANPHLAAVPVAKPQAEAPKTQAPLVFDTPAGWQPGRTSTMRTAAFSIVDGDGQAEATVIALPAAAGSQITDVDANVQRWAGQVGLADLVVGDVVEKTTIDGIEGSYVALLGPEDDQRPAGLLAAMVERDGKVWFFKLTGDRSLVELQQDAFRDFLASVRFQ